MRKYNKEIEENALGILIDRFLAGKTSMADERRIYDAFARHPEGSLSEQCEKYRPMFAWYAALPSVPAQPRRAARQWWKYTAAAAIAALLCFGILMIPELSLRGDRDDLEARYGGSYIVRDGKRITDLDEIMVSLMKAEQIADSIDCLAEKRMKEADANYEHQILESSISEIQDSTLARQLREDLLGNKVLSKI